LTPLPKLNVVGSIPIARSKSLSDTDVPLENAIARFHRLPGVDCFASFSR